MTTTEVKPTSTNDEAQELSSLFLKIMFNLDENISLEEFLKELVRKLIKDEPELITGLVIKQDQDSGVPNAPSSSRVMTAQLMNKSYQ